MSFERLRVGDQLWKALDPLAEQAEFSSLFGHCHVHPGMVNLLANAHIGLSHISPCSVHSIPFRDSMHEVRIDLVPREAVDAWVKHLQLGKSICEYL